MFLNASVGHDFKQGSLNSQPGRTNYHLLTLTDTEIPYLNDRTEHLDAQQNISNVLNMQNMQNMQKMQDMQNMQNT